MTSNPYVMLLLAIVTSVAGQLLLKRGMSNRPGFQVRQVLSLTRDPAVVGGFAAYGVSTLLYFRVLASLDLSVAYPSVSLGYVLIIILSRVLFRESVSRVRWLAAAIISMGVVLVGIAAR